jgi:hypothetical protein
MRDGHTAERRGRGPFAAIWVTLAVFLTLLAVLAVRVASGEDPALLALKARAPRPARQVLVRRIYERVVVVHLPANATQHGSSSSQQVSSEPAASSPGALVTRTS